MQWCFTISLLGIDIRPMLNKKLHRHRIARFGGEVQWCHTIFSPRIDVRLAGQEQFQDLNAIRGRMPNCEMEC